MFGSGTLRAVEAPLFAYGTLLDPKVRRLVAPGVSLGPVARLPHHRVGALRGRSYPGLRPWPEALAHGRLLQVPQAAWVWLDDYEGGEYERRIRPVLVEGGQRAAWVYLLRVELWGLFSGLPWTGGSLRR